jgi:hypothetical protein
LGAVGVLVIVVFVLELALSLTGCSPDLEPFLAGDDMSCEDERLGSSLPSEASSLPLCWSLELISDAVCDFVLGVFFLELTCDEAFLAGDDLETFLAGGDLSCEDDRLGSSLPSEASSLPLSWSLELISDAVCDFVLGDFFLELTCDESFLAGDDLETFLAGGDLSCEDERLGSSLLSEASSLPPCWSL